jgi:hypothetical protein
LRVMACLSPLSAVIVKPIMYTARLATSKQTRYASGLTFKEPLTMLAVQFIGCHFVIGGARTNGNCTTAHPICLLLKI